METFNSFREKLDENKKLNKEEIELTAWFKNNEEWFKPVASSSSLSLDAWENYEILNFYNFKNFLVYCWNTSKEDGRLFKAQVKK